MVPPSDTCLSSLVVAQSWYELCRREEEERYRQKGITWELERIDMCSLVNLFTLVR